MAQPKNPLDMDILNLINSARADPKSLVTPLEKMLSCFEGDILRREGKVNLRTKEGTKAVQEAIDFCKS
jgi:hypothetical protein